MKIILFLLLNFSALAIGGLLMGKGAGSDWYNALNKAPWTPPGWTFGAAWFTIMVCFSFYMASLVDSVPNKSLFILLFAVQWILNVSWNPVFFNFHLTTASLVIIIALTVLVAFLFFNYFQVNKMISLLILPYLIWLIIATSLNAYISLNN